MLALGVSRQVVPPGGRPMVPPPSPFTTICTHYTIFTPTSLHWPTQPAQVTREDMVAEGVGSARLVRILEKPLHLVHHNTGDIWRPAYHVHPPSEHHKSLLDPRP
ncbi:hypothetical protein Pcinc_036149 [Petrolisthes cinctipes]|uniref:Uncharacterized protein n=1 Tax=Petrolisthes cinctipes TaxID=88211 RepID=A0AAE1BWP6_PETCI|nr:hypothetical protein Pcinc_036149 [Petrolisthes cinctipes]